MLAGALARRAILNLGRESPIMTTSAATLVTSQASTLVYQEVGQGQLLSSIGPSFWGSHAKQILQVKAAPRDSTSVASASGILSAPRDDREHIQ